MNEIGIEKSVFADIFRLWQKYRAGIFDIEALTDDFNRFLEKYRGMAAADLSNALMNAVVDVAGERGGKINAG